MIVWKNRKVCDKRQSQCLGKKTELDKKEGRIIVSLRKIVEGRKRFGENVSRRPSIPVVAKVYPTWLFVTSRNSISWSDGQPRLLELCCNCNTSTDRFLKKASLRAYRFGSEESMNDKENGFNIGEHSKGKYGNCTREVHKQKIAKSLVKDGSRSRRRL